jgi:hypothetical protein
MFGYGLEVQLMWAFDIVEGECGPYRVTQIHEESVFKQVRYGFQKGSK